MIDNLFLTTKEGLYSISIIYSHHISENNISAPKNSKWILGERDSTLEEQ